LLKSIDSWASSVVMMTPPLTLKTAVLAPLLALALLLGSVPGPSAATTVTSDRLVATARAQLGVPYAFSGVGPATFDCSGLVRFVFARHGITTIPRTSLEQFRWAQPVTRTQLRPGDLVFQSFSERNGIDGVDHVAIYVGDGRVVDASSGQGRVIERAIIERAVIGYGRVPGVSASPARAPAPAPAPVIAPAPVKTPAPTPAPAPAVPAVTRAEAAKIFADTLKLPNRRNPFEATEHGGAVGAVHHAGIGRPYRDGTWRPNAALTAAHLVSWLDRADLTRAQAARIVASVLRLPDRPNPFGITTHGGAVGALYHARIALPYRDGTWRPKAPATRTQMERWVARSGLK
jgi:hypothetical protein